MDLYTWPQVFAVAVPVVMLIWFFLALAVHRWVTWYRNNQPGLNGARLAEDWWFSSRFAWLLVWPITAIVMLTSRKDIKPAAKPGSK